MSRTSGGCGETSDKHGESYVSVTVYAMCKCANKCPSPARFFATVVIKLTLAHILMNYDVELKGKNTQNVSSTWRSYNFPREDLTVLLKPRDDAAQ
jgi:hypothetical protein